MKLTKCNKGFSFVELIIVIAIMAVMIGVLAPQYLKFVTNARVTTDVTNAEEMAKFVDIAIAGRDGASVPTLISGTGGTAVSNVPGLDTLPACKLNASYVWEIHSTQGTGVSQITLNGFVIYPDSEVTGGYYTEYHVN